MEMESASTVSSTTLHGTQFPYTTKWCWTPPPQPVSSQGKSFDVSTGGRATQGRVDALVPIEPGEKKGA